MEEEKKKSKLKIIIPIIIVIAIVASVAIVIINNRNTEETNTTEIKSTETNTTSQIKYWTTPTSVDEFGDITEDSEVYLQSKMVVGNFSNTATSNSDLLVYVFIPQNYTMSFRLLEYGNHQATYTKSDTEGLKLKIKIDDNVEEYDLNGVAPNGDLFLSSTDGNKLFNYLYSGKDIKCIINIGNSKYNFTVKSENIVEACEEGNEKIDIQEEANKVKTIDEALKVYSKYDSKRKGEATNYFTEKINTFTLLNGDDINKLIEENKTWLEITCKYGYWTMYEFLDGLKTQIGRFNEGKYEEHRYNGQSFRVENDLLYLDILKYGSTEKGVYYQIRELKKGYYLAYETDDSGNYTIPSYLAIQYGTDGQPVY